MLREFYLEAWALNEVSPADIPSEVAEGDESLWADFAAALAAVAPTFSNQVLTGLGEAARRLRGDSTDFTVLSSKDEVSKLLLD